ncbi:polysaccharide deacetylase family protein [Thiohalorhabdus sp. Cl-TMA]|uniref:Polysaccharide deacetylase family protein n=1 Tax=Thiohalorhabdus methylotrophus TaxID=3242694 RepID=A0ABV4TV16_9GAMM
MQMQSRAKDNLLHRIVFLGGLLLGTGAAAPAAADNHAVILEYHNVSTETPPSTSVTPKAFDRHLAFLEEQDFTVWPLIRILRHLDQDKPLPDNTVALTFDDAYKSVYTEVFPRLERRDWPFTVFVSTGYIDKGFGNYMSWDQLREVAAGGAHLGNHSRSHPHLVRRKPGEGEQAWRQRIREEINGAQKRLEAEVGDPVPVFAYPFGEFAPDVEAVVAELGFYGVGQQSGAVGKVSNLRAAPRFPVATGYDDLDSLATKLRSRPLGATVLAPEDGMLSAGTQRPELRMRLGDGPYRLGALACYASGQGRMDVDWIDRAAGEVAVRPRKPLSPGRTKYNCTAPSTESGGVFYWFSFLWMKPNPDGSWYRE